MKVSSIAKQLESVLNRPPTMDKSSEKKDETPIIHSKVELTDDNSGNNIVLYGRAIKKKKAPIKFDDN